MRALLFFSAAIVVTGCVQFGAAEEPPADEGAPAGNTPVGRGTSDMPPTSNNTPSTGSPACTFVETFEDDAYLGRWSAVGSKGTAERVAENGNGFLRVSAPDDDTRFFGRTILEDDTARVLAVRGRMRVVKASTKGEVDVFRIVSAVPTVSDPVGAAASIVRPYNGGPLVAETMINENGDGPTPIALGTEVPAAWTNASITIDRDAKTVTIALGDKPPTVQPMPDRMAKGSLALQIGAPYNYEAETWTVDLDDVCVSVVR